VLYQLDLEASDASLTPLAFEDFGSLGMLEKQLESLISDHLLDVLFDEGLMTIFRERPWQPEADLYAVMRNGDLVVFELKRSVVGADAVQQVIGYVGVAGRWSYAELNDKYGEFCRTHGQPHVDLRAAHQEAFGLLSPLGPSDFNRSQHLWLIGSAADDELEATVDFWKAKGLPISFVPYRVYRIGSKHYFELFALPYDRHSNPAEQKGVIFDTNRSYDEESVWSMLQNRRIAAYGNSRFAVECLARGDWVFYSHKGTGVIAAAKVVSEIRKPNDEGWFHDVEFLTKVPSRPEGIKRAVPFSRVSEVCGRSFFWARTNKTPYLSPSESERLLEECVSELGSS